MQLPEPMPAGSPLGYGNAPFPFLSLPGNEILASLAELTSAYQDATPVLWGDADEAARLFELFDENIVPDAEQTLRAAAGQRGAELIDLWRSEIRGRLAEYERSRGRNPVELDEPLPPRGEFPANVAPHSQPLSIMDFARRAPKKTLLIGLIPTARAWEIPAFHKFGSWNDCPPPAVHVALAREWHERFGARLIANTADVLEFSIERPVCSRDEAVALALEHYSYCPDIVLQGVGTIDALAAHLLGARYWYFWWD